MNTVKEKQASKTSTAPTHARTTNNPGGQQVPSLPVPSFPVLSYLPCPSNARPNADARALAPRRSTRDASLLHRARRGTRDTGHGAVGGRRKRPRQRGNPAPNAVRGTRSSRQATAQPRPEPAPRRSHEFRLPQVLPQHDITHCARARKMC